MSQKEKTALQKNIDRYMDKHGIRFYVDLLKHVGKQLKVKDTTAFALREKDNFSKMLKGDRPLKYEFITPLEKIFGVSLARLMDEGAYQIPIKKEDMPYIKGFRYYAYKDDPKLYEEEFEQSMIAVDGTPSIFYHDEFGKGFLDYVAEYHSINGLKYLINKYNLKAIPWNSGTYNADIGGKHLLSTNIKNVLELMIVQEDDAALFNSFFSPFELFVISRYDYPNSPFASEDIIEAILLSKNVYKTIFETRTLTYKECNPTAVLNERTKDIRIQCINPLINICLDYCLNHLDKYKDKAIEILRFGISYNPTALEKTQEDTKYLYVRDFGNVFYKGGYEFITNMVYSSLKTDNLEIQQMLDEVNLLPSFQ